MKKKRLEELEEEELEELEYKAREYQGYLEDIDLLVRYEDEGTKDQAEFRDYYNLRNEDNDNMIIRHFGNKAYYRECQQAYCDYLDYLELKKMMEEQKQLKAQKSKKKTQK